MLYSFYDLLWMFVLYAILGWCAEVAFHAAVHGNFANRGFLNGPLCPIYGIGAVTVIVCLTPIQDKLLVLFLGSVVLTSLLELVTGFVLEKIFHNQWWDYSDAPFNIGGYVCLKFSLLWGIACVLLVRVLQPVVYRVIQMIPRPGGIAALSIFGVLLLSDIVVTVVAIHKLNVRLKRMNEIASRLHQLSDGMGEKISEGMCGLLKKEAELKETAGLARKGLQKQYEKESSELKAKYQELLQQQNFLHKRLLKAFPSIKSNQFGEALERLKQKLKK